MTVREGGKASVQKPKTKASGPSSSCLIDGDAAETVTDYFFGLQNHCRW